MIRKRTFPHNPDRFSGRRPSGRHRLGRALALLVTGITIAAGAGILYAGVLAAVIPGVEVRNGGMEEPFVGGIALPWMNNTWGDATASFSEDTSRPHSGHSAQHIHCESVNGGAAQIRQMGIAVRAGQVYTLTLWMRGQVENSGLRRRSGKRASLPPVGGPGRPSHSRMGAVRDHRRPGAGRAQRRHLHRVRLAG